MLFIIVLCAACNTPGYTDLRRPFTMVQIADSRFKVYTDATSAVAIRTNPDMRPRPSKIFPRAVQAMEQASGCKVVPGSVQGDPAMIKAQITC